MGALVALVEGGLKLWASTFVPVLRNWLHSAPCEGPGAVVLVAHVGGLGHTVGSMADALEAILSELVEEGPWPWDVGRATAQALSWGRWRYGLMSFVFARPESYDAGLQATIAQWKARRVAV